MVIRYRNLLTNILFWIILILCAYFAENIVLFDIVNFQRGFSLIEYVLLFTGIIVLLSYFLYYEHKDNGLRLNWIVSIVLFVVVISASIGIILTPEIQSFEVIEFIDGVETPVIKDLVVTFEDKIHSFLFVIIAAFGIYLQLVIMPRLISFRRYVLFLMYVVVVVAFVTAIFSYILDYESYVHLYKFGLVGYKYPQSYLFNRNMYALVLMLGMLALYNIISTIPKWYNYGFLIFFFVNILFTFSKAATGIAIITFGVHFIYRMIVTFKYHKVRNWIYVGIVIVLGICGILLIPFPFFMDIRLFNEGRRFILEYYIELGVGSYDSRNEIWQSIINISTGHYFWFGRGLDLFNRTLTIAMGDFQEYIHQFGLFAHNGFLETFGQWGIIGLAFYLIIILVLFIIIIYAVVKNYRIGFPSLIVFGAFLGYTMVETSTLFDLTIEGIATTTIVVLPVLSWFYAKRHPKANCEIVQSAESLEYGMPKYDAHAFTMKVANNVALFLGLIVIVVFFYFYQVDMQINNFIILLVLAMTIFIVLPRSLGNVYELKKTNKIILFYLLNTFLILANAAAIFLYALTVSSLVMMFSINALIINLLISERISKSSEVKFKEYLIQIIGRSSIIFLAITFSGTLIVLMASGLTWFVVSEIVFLFIILSIPFIRTFDVEKNALNRTMLLTFAKAIK